MKRSATNRNLLVVLLVMVAGAVGVKYLKDSRFETGESAQAAESLFGEFSTEDVTHLEIKGPDSQHVQLQKDGDEWKVASAGNYRADASAVTQALDSLKDLKQGRVISSKTDQLDTYELADEQAIKITAKDQSGSPLAQLTLGKTSDDFRSFYFQLADENRVRKADGPIRAKFDKSQVNTSWRDQTVFDGSVMADDVRSLRIDRDGQLAVVFEKEDIMGPKEPVEGAAEGEDSEEEPGEPEQEVKESIWNMTVPEAGRAVTYQVDNMARTLTDLRCDGFYEGEQSMADLGLGDTPRYRLVINAGLDTENELWMGDKLEDNQYPIRQKDGNVVFLIQSWRGDYFTKEAGDYLEVKDDPETMSEFPLEDVLGDPPAGGALESLEEAAGEQLEEGQATADEIVETVADEASEINESIEEVAPAEEAPTGDGS